MKTSSGVTVRSPNEDCVPYAFSDRGSSEVFQQLSKKLLNIFAFSLSLQAMYSPCCKVGTVSLFLLRNLTHFHRFL